MVQQSQTTKRSFFLVMRHGERADFVAEKFKEGAPAYDPMIKHDPPLTLKG